MENPPNKSGQKRAMSDTCDVIINDTDDGVVLVVDHRDPKPYTMRFDFGASENLALNLPSEHVEAAGDMKCNIKVQQQTINLCHLKIADRETKSSFEMRYRVQCLVRNEKTGELEQVKAPGGGGGGGGGGGERKVITETLTLVIQKASDGYILFLESSDAQEYKIQMDFGKSENLALNLGPKSTQEGAMIAALSLPPKGNEPFAKMSIVDRSKGGCALDYTIKHSRAGGSSHVDPNAEADRKAKEDAATKKKADDEAAAKKKADDEAAAAAAAAKKKADDEAAAAAAKKKADDEAAAAKKAKEDADRKAKLEEINKLLAEHQEEQRRWRIKIEAEWKVRWTLYFKQWTESVCNLCRKVFPKDCKLKQYKQYMLHEECYDKAAKCTQCNDILVGEYVQAKGDGSKEGIKLHKECIEAYKLSSRPTCAACGKQILDPKWSTAGGKPYHSSCREPSPQ